MNRPLDGKKVVVVEEDAVLGHILEYLLKTEGAHVWTAGDADEGRALAAKHHPHLIVALSDSDKPLHPARFVERIRREARGEHG